MGRGRRPWFAAQKKNCRLVGSGEAVGPGRELRAVRGGLLPQTGDDGDPPSAMWRVVGRRPPTDEEMAALRFAWLASQHVKSNAIVLARPTGAPGVVATVGIGGGLPSRVDAGRLALPKAGKRARGAGFGLSLINIRRWRRTILGRSRWAPYL